MSNGWTSYSPSDFLLFSGDVYTRQLTLHNDAWWPLHVLTLVFGAFAIFTVSTTSTSAKRFAYAGLAASWAFVAWAFLWERYQQINWAAAYVVPAFAVEAVLLALLAARPPPAAATSDRSKPAFAALAIGGFALVAYPLMAGLMGRTWSSADVFGIAPDSTALVTLAVLIGARGTLAMLALVIPVLWCAATGLTLWVLGFAEFWLAPALATAALVTAIIYRSIRKV